MKRSNFQKDILGLIAVSAALVLVACSTVLSQKSGVKFLGNKDRGNLIDLAWSPTGENIAVTSYNYPNYSKIYLLDVSTQEFRKILDTTYGSIIVTGWSPDGKQILFNSSEGGKEFRGGLWMHDVESQAPAQYLTDGQLAALSPLGDKLAVFKVMRNTYKWEDISLHLIDLASSRDEVIYEAQGKYIRGLSWSPDGKRLVFAFSPEVKIDRVDIFVLNVTDNKIEQLTASGQNISPTWSPISEMIAYIVEGADNKSELYVYDMDKKCSVILPTDKNPSAPTWSPDGKHIAFISDVRGVYMLYLPSEISSPESCR